MLSVIPTLPPPVFTSSSALTATVLVFTSIFDVFIVAVMVVVIRYRKVPVFRAASPPFLLVILFGLLFATAYPLLTVLNAEPTVALCALRWLFPLIAFGLVFGRFEQKQKENQKVQHDLRCA